MASKRERKAGTWEFAFKNKILKKTVYKTFDTEKEGDDYAILADAYLKKGIVPPGFEQDDINDSGEKIVILSMLIREYCSKVDVPHTDFKLLGIISERHGLTSLARIDIKWCEVWIEDMKRRLNLAPSTIRHHVGALARCFDWAERRDMIEFARNPLRRLPIGFSTYTKKDEVELKKNFPDAEVKLNTKRTRRLELDEEENIRRVMSGYILNGKQRAIRMDYEPALKCLFELALESAMRLREIFTLTIGQVDIEKSAIQLLKTKNGTQRQVPMTSVAKACITNYVTLVASGDPAMSDFKIENEEDLLFPWWDGVFAKKSLNRTTSRLSGQFGRIFEAAMIKDFHFHDLRHEATSRLFERTDLDFVEIAKITGHTDPRMLMIYANLRASSLAKRLW